MKNLKRLKLNQIGKAELEKREMNFLLGGNCCNCGCAYAGNGGSSTSDNLYANSDNGYTITATGPGGVQGCSFDGGMCTDVHASR